MPTTNSVSNNIYTGAYSTFVSIDEIIRQDYTLSMQHLLKDGSVTTAEVSPLLMVTCEEMSQRIRSDGGSGLVVDYGEDGLTDFTLRVCVVLSTHVLCTEIHCIFV